VQPQRLLHQQPHLLRLHLQVLHQHLHPHQVQPQALLLPKHLMTILMTDTLGLKHLLHL
jgi:hypothetical protein